jgi:hypothetical protein
MPLRDAALRRWRAVLGGVGLLVVLVALPGTSQAICLWPQEAGDWTNIDPDTRSVTRIQLEFVCQDTIVNGQPFPPGPPWWVRVWGKCHPSDCDWGRVGAKKLDSGWIHAVFHQSFATKHVYARMAPARPGQLQVRIYTDHTAADGRKDRATNAWFVKKGG